MKPCSLDQELRFIAGDFINWEIPKELRFVYDYFNTDVEKTFIKYYLCFGNFTKFAEHTGLQVTRRWCEKLRQRLVMVQKLHEKAHANGDIEQVAEIEAGNAKIKLFNPRTTLKKHI